MITLDRAIGILSKEAQGIVTFNDEHDEAIRMALDVLIKIKLGQVKIKFTKEHT